jgi:hypothetical protein
MHFSTAFKFRSFTGVILHPVRNKGTTNLDYVFNIRLLLTLLCTKPTLPTKNTSLITCCIARRGESMHNL